MRERTLKHPRRSKSIGLGKFRNTMASCVGDIRENNAVYTVTRGPGRNQKGEPTPEFVAMSITMYDTLCETMDRVDELLKLETGE